MANYTFAELPKWAIKTEKNMDTIVRQSLNDTLNSIQIVPGKGRGGSPQLGEIPRDTGALAQSLVSEIHGGISNKKASGENSHALVIDQIDSKSGAAFS